jgi:citrate lyase subunit beta/citryl-CoA lyase
MRSPVRSLLFVPGDSERKLEKSAGSRADALVFDLEDSVTQARKQVAREMIAAHLGSGAGGPGTEQWVRINPVSTQQALEDLAAIVPGRPAGIVLPKAEGPADVARVGNYLDVLEVREGLPRGSIRIIAVATETARASLNLHRYAEAELPRLTGLTWGAEDVSADIGAASNKDDDGRLALTYRVIRSLALLAARSCGIEAIDTVYPDFRDLDGLRETCIAACREGFTGCFAIHPAQVDVINEAYSPTAEAVEYAKRVLAAFAADPEAGTVGLDGKMLDKPHLVQAQKVLAMRDALAERR